MKWVPPTRPLYAKPVKSLSFSFQDARIPLIHLKDAKELGRGPVDFPTALAATKQVAAAKTLVVEQNEYSVPPLEAVRLDFGQLRAWNLV